ncbi:cupredoxin domain-containing protein [Aspergillus affinis]|uniref:cupredoxin domain-containing protein n=1 Tax=Aspergillus affinis TaxID=1070780 RepID=UPI0022FE204B|nr:uncharacterized protein KD926_009732 [Aspergillus affinis]KAI9039290.1 hypothetical protein KD926_009732 [Aspergillus affinis]
MPSPVRVMTWLLLVLQAAMVSTQTTSSDNDSYPTATGKSSRTQSMTKTTATTTSASKTTSSTTGTATHTVKVGSKEDPHQYSPHNITANVGDVIIFEFYPRNHSVVRADYLAPCVPASKDVFWSGEFNKFNENNGQLIGPPPTWSLVVNDTAPTFFYCTAIDSCIGNGMVGVINPNSSMTWEAQYEKAKDYPYMLVPGQSPPAEGDQPNGTSSPSPSSSSNGGGGGLSGGAIAGIVVGCVAFVAILIALFFALGRNRIYKKWMSSEDGRTERTAQWALFNSHGERKSEMTASAPGHPGDQGTFVSSPDPTQRAFSPPPQPASGHWSWDSTSFQQQQQHQQQMGQMGQMAPTSGYQRGPTELEAPMPMTQIPESHEHHDGR